MGRLKQVVRPRKPEATPQKGQRRSPRLIALPNRSTKTFTPAQRRSRKSSNFQKPSKSSSKATQPQSTATQRRFSIDEAPKLGTYMLVLYVGPYRTLTTIHNDVLPTSTIIALRGLYQYGFAHLEAHSVESFELYRVWLYTGKLCTRIPNEEEEVGAEDAVWVDCEWGRMANAYFLAVDLRDEKFGNAIVDAMIEKVDGSEYYPTSLAADLYASTPQGDGMSRLIVDFHV
ncbi:hypothetical protein B0A48_07862 [Cryoendolithus antarcticus]|uniref:BTB domain-containing protein n=1 Tax=Cryoendolithus antarcticus TaxID=1507870 RepID=A0A1V8T0A2_9PEZI|nr:hypothetical protein B0A48_07862 [Cryoendolithus antarcticus]